MAKTSGDRSRQVFSDLPNTGAEKNWRRFRGLPVCLKCWEIKTIVQKKYQRESGSDLTMTGSGRGDLLGGKGLNLVCKFGKLGNQSED